MIVNGEPHHGRPFKTLNLAYQAALEYLQRGWSVIPVAHRSKNPGISDWQNLRVTAETVSRYFGGRRQNIGVLLGEPSGGLIDVDLDHKRAIELAPQFLPATSATFGRPSKPRSHWIYKGTAPAATKRFGSKAAGMLVELRSTGQQTVFPPSAHESGEGISWDQKAYSPTIVEPAHLLECVERLAEAVRCDLRVVRRVSNTSEAIADCPSLDTTRTARSDLSWVCLAAMVRLSLIDRRDGSNRLFAAACRAVEYDLDDRLALATIREYAIQKPFPRVWTDQEIIRRIRDAERRCRRGAALARDAAGNVQIGWRDLRSGRLVLSPTKTLPTAEAYLRDFHLHPDGYTLVNYGWVLLEWRDNHYRAVEDNFMNKRLQEWLHTAMRFVPGLRGRPELEDFDSNPRTIKAALDSLKFRTHIDGTVEVPSWLNEPAPEFSALDFLACRSKLLHLPTMRHFPPTPSFFTLNALGFDHDAKAPHASLWHHFTTQLFGEDRESLELLQEWFGYCLTADTSQQKMLLIVGPKRSGKGTIAKVLTELIGGGNVSSPTTSSLAHPFGLQSLIGKTLAVVSDARFQGEGVSSVVERLLCISGEDSLTVERKYLASVTMKLPTRFMFLSNELPRLHDASGALANRFLLLRLSQSFFGKEDIGLANRLLGELPGILNWAIEGWHRLRQRGHFVLPSSSSTLVEEIEELSSPVAAFVREICEVGPAHRVTLQVLYAAWCQWCQEAGSQSLTTKQVFGRNVQAAVPGIQVRRGTNQYRFYEGIGLKASGRGGPELGSSNSTVAN